MKIFVKVKTKAKEDKIEKIGDNQFSVWVKELPIEGRANEAVRKMLAEYFEVAQARIKIIAGVGSKQKIIEII